MTLDCKLARLVRARSERAVAGNGVGGSGMVGEASGLHFRMGRLEIDPNRTAIIDESEDEARLGIPMPVTVGGEAFRDHVVDIDFAHHRIAFRDPDRFTPPSDAIALQVQTVGDLRSTAMSIEGRSARMIVDLGTGAPVFLYPRFWKRTEFLAHHWLADTFVGGWTGAHPEKIAMLGFVRIGRTTLARPYANLLSKDRRSGNVPVDGNVGMPVLSRFRLVLDYPHNRIFLASPIGTKDPFRVNHTGIYLRRSNAGQTVVFVAPGSPAEKARLKVGAIVTAVEDRTEGKMLAPESAWLETPTGHRLKLSLAEGETVTINTGAYF